VHHFVVFDFNFLMLDLLRVKRMVQEISSWKDLRQDFVTIVLECQLASFGVGQFKRILTNEIFHVAPKMLCLVYQFFVCSFASL